MASIVLSHFATSLGNAILPGLGGRLLGQVGRQVGRALDIRTGIASGPRDGARLNSVRIQDSRYGIGLPRVFGRVRVAGNVIWASDLIETAHESRVSGGKGGVVGGALGVSRTTYSYSLHCAVAIALGEIGDIATIWADSKVIWQNGVWASGVTGGATFHYGTDPQNPDPLLESWIGAGKVPGWRGVAYVVFESLQLGAFGNRLPNLTFEILPKETSATPLWEGATESATVQKPVTLRNAGMRPLILESGSVSARRVLVGGLAVSGATACFEVVEYDVTGAAPVELERRQSASFGVSNVVDQSWALAPDRRFVALSLLDNQAASSSRFVLYDTVNRSFGAILPLALPVSIDTRPLAWIDSMRVVVSDAASGHRGLRVLARAGTGLVDLGFFDVWGAGSTSTRYPLAYAQFTPLGNGVLHYAANAVTGFTTLYACAVRWQGNALVADAPYTVASGLATGSGSGAQVFLERLPQGEWAFLRATAVDVRMLSFLPGPASATVTRPWQVFANQAFATCSGTAPFVTGNRIVAVRRNAYDNYYSLSRYALGEGSFTREQDDAPVANFDAALADFTAMAVDPVRVLLLGGGGFDSHLAQIALLRRRETGESLAAIVGAILEAAGYAPADYDVAALADLTVDGYVLDDPVAARNALRPLQTLEPFDLVESGAQLRAVRRHATPDIVIPDGEEGATAKGVVTEPSVIQRHQEIKLPQEIIVEHLDAARDYEVGSQRARRSVTRGSRATVTLDLPLVCTAERAKRLAETQLYTAWTEREGLRVSWSRRWIAAEPGDVVEQGGRRFRLTHIRHEKGVVDVEGVLIPAVGPVSAARAETGDPSLSPPPAAPGATAFLMDLPPLRAEDDQPGFYAALGGPQEWPGGSLWRASEGVNYALLSSFPAPATAGFAVAALADGPVATRDRAATVQVQLLQGTLASCTEDELLNGANAARLGTEIIQFQTATLLGPGLYVLGGLLRGRRGTGTTTATHAAGEPFVLLTPGAVQFLPALLTDRGRTVQMRALTAGQTLGEVADTPFTYGLETLKPFAPVHITGRRAAGTGTDLALAWKRCARRDAGWVDHIDTPLDEPEERYEVEILNGASVVRLYAGLTTPSVTYAAAEQTADWGGSVPASFTVRVFQLSARYGRGAAGQAVV